ncbi:TPA: hypothetical protein R0E72_004433 [Aeromonas hydrophila subsp. hydrophila]|nr:hypothetical protein [Aeromonas hydrophila subsp. hydrophila]
MFPQLAGEHRITQPYPPPAASHRAPGYWGGRRPPAGIILMVAGTGSPAMFTLLVAEHRITQPYPPPAASHRAPGYWGRRRPPAGIILLVAEHRVTGHDHSS